MKNVLHKLKKKHLSSKGTADRHYNKFTIKHLIFIETVITF